MKIKISFIKILDVRKADNDSYIEIKADSTVKELLEFLEIKKYPISTISVMVNGVPAWRSTVLKENDNVMLLVPLGGG
jgi:sulfur carrier protein ThiS